MCPPGYWVFAMQDTTGGQPQEFQDHRQGRRPVTTKFDGMWMKPHRRGWISSQGSPHSHCTAMFFLFKTSRGASASASSLNMFAQALCLYHTPPGVLVTVLGDLLQ